ncbi:hypothetical protein BDZ89DRAFT_1189309 [Hymenopellis radicata]|nr:hypothetical protein BDZ89DRAFT_1189309 [Hymenopellis radicata]
MPPFYRWNHPHGREILQKIVKKTVPKWTEGLRDAQLEYVPPILDCEDVLCVEVTGGGKSAAFSVPILVHNEVAANPHLYPRFSCRNFAVGIIVTPTKGLAGDIVHELEELGIRALAYTAARKTEAHKNREKLAEEIASCKRWQVICVDPEHLRDEEWRKTIPRSSAFRENLIYACAEEGHLLNEWGLSFRKAFGFIGVYFRGLLPSTISVFTLSATLPPGEQTRRVCRNLGFTRGNYTTIRHSNERKNIEISFAPLQDAIGGKSFPQLLDYVLPGHKIIIHCATIDQVLRVFIYLWKMAPPDMDFLRHVRMYHSLCSDTYNRKTLELLDTDLYCRIVIGTVALANGINTRTLTIAILLGFPETINEAVQRMGHIGRVRSMLTHAITLIQPRQITASQKQLTSPVAPTNVKAGKHKTKRIEDAKTRVLTERVCIVAAFNREYENSPLAISLLDCRQAGRVLYCSICRERYPDYTVDFPIPVYPADSDIPPPFLTPLPKEKAKKSYKIPKELRPNHEKKDYEHLPRLAFFPSSLTKLVITNIHSISDTASLLNLIGPSSWRFSFAYGPALFDVISEIQRLLPKMRKKQAKKGGSKGKRKRVVESSEDEDTWHSGDDESEAEQLSSPQRTPLGSPAPSSPRRPPPKRQALADVTNMLPVPATAARQLRQPRQPRKPLEAAAAVLADMRPPRIRNSTGCVGWRGSWVRVGAGAGVGSNTDDAPKIDMSTSRHPGALALAGRVTRGSKPGTRTHATPEYPTRVAHPFAGVPHTRVCRHSCRVAGVRGCTHPYSWIASIPGNGTGTLNCP